MHSRKTMLLVCFLVIPALYMAANAMEASYEPWESLHEESMSPNMAYAFSGAPSMQPGHYDRNGDGIVDLIVSDRNGDGRADYWATDRNFNGKIDDYQYDRNFNGQIDQWEYDTNGNGIPDRIYVDSNGDGQANMYAMLNPITRTYTWYGDMSTISASSHRTAFPPVAAQRNYRGGRPTDSN